MRGGQLARAFDTTVRATSGYLPGVRGVRSISRTPLARAVYSTPSPDRITARSCARCSCRDSCDVCEDGHLPWSKSRLRLGLGMLVRCSGTAGAARGATTGTRRPNSPSHTVADVPSGPFDLVTCIEVIRHTENLSRSSPPSTRWRRPTGKPLSTGWSTARSIRAVELPRSRAWATHHHLQQAGFAAAAEAQASEEVTTIHNRCRSFTSWCKGRERSVSPCSAGPPSVVGRADVLERFTSDRTVSGGGARPLGFHPA